MTVSMKMLHPRNLPNRDTRIPWYFAKAQFEIVPGNFEFLEVVDFGGVAISVECII